MDRLRKESNCPASTDRTEYSVLSTQCDMLWVTAVRVDSFKSSQSCSLDDSASRSHVLAATEGSMAGTTSASTGSRRKGAKNERTIPLIRSSSVPNTIGRFEFPV